MAKKLTKCDFCKYKTGSGCSVKADSSYCREANNEFFAYLAELKKKESKKSRGNF